MGWVLFFDGECAFCSASVRQVVKSDKRGRIHFAPLQGKLAQEMGFASSAAKVGGTVVILRESDGKIFTHSDAWIELARALGGWWSILRILRFVPRFIRDFVYRLVADNRYKIMGKADTCSQPDPVLLARLRE